MSDGITDAERECNCELCQQLRSARECQKLHGIIYFSTKELVEELANREGVKEIPYESFQTHTTIFRGKDGWIKYELKNKVRILVIH